MCKHRHAVVILLPKYVTIKLKLPTKTLLIMVYKIALGSLTSRFFNMSIVYIRDYIPTVNAYCQCSPRSRTFHQISQVVVHLVPRSPLFLFLIMALSE